jgi:hypothetical protein
MNQLITLLSNLFNLTKVASVTLPGLLAAGGLTLILWPAIPVDLIPLATVRSVQELAAFPDHDPAYVPPDPTCDPSTLGRRSAYDRACYVNFLPMPEIVEFIKEDEKEKKKAEESPNTKAPPPGSDQKPTASIPAELEDIAPQLLQIEGQDTYPRSRKEQIQEQLILDFENQKLSECLDLETSLKGREATENQQLKADLDIEEKQRSSAQDSYLAYLKSNNLPLASRYSFQGCITLKRYSVIWNERDIAERDRRVTELTRDQGILTARLADPGRLRPRLGFDDFLAGLVNHVVAFILLSLAAAIIVTALDRTVFFGGLFEDLFDGF